MTKRDRKPAKDLDPLGSFIAAGAGVLAGQDVPGRKGAPRRDAVPGLAPARKPSQGKHDRPKAGVQDHPATPSPGM